MTVDRPSVERHVDSVASTSDGKATSSEDAYWESLLQDGEVVSLEVPPPWIRTSSGRSGHVSHESMLQAEEEDWQRAARLLETGECCHLVTTGHNRGGLLVQFGMLTGFVPSSHLIGFPAYPDPLDRKGALLERVGRQCQLKIIEIDRERGRLILSERAAAAGTQYDQIFARIRPGDVVQGCVSNLRRFGAFVDLGGFEGLIHISEMSWGRVNQPGDVVQVGDEIQVFVLDVNAQERKIQLSLKRLQPDPWRSVAERYSAGETVAGEVTNVVSFGAFVRIEEGVEGLIHISELAEGNFLHPRNVVQEGEWVEARILNVDPHNRRIGLSLRQNHDPNAVWPAATETEGRTASVSW